MVKFKLFEFEQVFNVGEVAGYEIIHPDHRIAIFNESIAQM